MSCSTTVCPSNTHCCSDGSSTWCCGSGLACGTSINSCPSSSSDSGATSEDTTKIILGIVLTGVFLLAIAAAYYFYLRWRKAKDQRHLDEMAAYGIGTSAGVRRAALHEDDRDEEDFGQDVENLDGDQGGEEGQGEFTNIQSVGPRDNNINNSGKKSVKFSPAGATATNASSTTSAAVAVPHPPSASTQQKDQDSSKPSAKHEEPKVFPGEIAIVMTKQGQMQAVPRSSIRVQDEDFDEEDLEEERRQKELKKQMKQNPALERQIRAQQKKAEKEGTANSHMEDQQQQVMVSRQRKSANTLQFALPVTEKKKKKTNQDDDNNVEQVEKQTEAPDQEAPSNENDDVEENNNEHQEEQEQDGAAAVVQEDEVRNHSPKEGEEEENPNDDGNNNDEDEAEDVK